MPYLEEQHREQLSRKYLASLRELDDAKLMDLLLHIVQVGDTSLATSLDVLEEAFLDKLPGDKRC